MGDCTLMAPIKLTPVTVRNIHAPIHCDPFHRSLIPMTRLRPFGAQAMLHFGAFVVAW